MAIVESYLESGKATGESAIERISYVYGSQAVVISIDPRRVYVASPDEVPQHVIPTELPGPQRRRLLLVPMPRSGEGAKGRPVDCRHPGPGV